MLSTTFAAGLSGIDGYIVTVECSVFGKIPEIQIIGLPDAAVREAVDRMKTAAVNCGFDIAGLEIILNLAPADRKKEGSVYDVAMFVAIVQGASMIPRSVDLSDAVFIGELSLSGEIRPVRGVLSMCIAARDAGMKRVFVPAVNAAEASVVDGIEVYAASSFTEITDHLSGRSKITPTAFSAACFEPEFDPNLDFIDVRGQQRAKRAMEIAAAGGHNILLIGPPGTGKSMLAKRLPTILPPLTFAEALETTRVHSVSGSLPPNRSLVTERPFRSPHHTMSAAALVGGGITVMPGEISLATNGVLFLDELPEFAKNVTESLRQPLEDGCVTISRSSGRYTFPSDFMIVCAMNPCRCGYFGHPTRPCTCTDTSRRTYLSKISGPLLDRIDLQIEMPPLAYDELRGEKTGDTSAEIRSRVVAARKIARERYIALSDKSDGALKTCNSQIPPHLLDKICPLENSASDLLKSAYERMSLSVRGRDRMIRVARTVADLDGREAIEARHIAEAINLRSLDKNYW